MIKAKGMAELVLENLLQVLGEILTKMSWPIGAISSTAVERRRSLQRKLASRWSSRRYTRSKRTRITSRAYMRMDWGDQPILKVCKAGWVRFKQPLWTELACSRA